jgi:hypothetical protein
MGARQALISRGRPLRLNTANIAADPQDSVTQPHHVMTPRTTTGFGTTGIIIGLKNIDSAAVAPGFSLILWIADPNMQNTWFRFTPVTLNDRDASVTYDINAFGLYLQVDPASVAVQGRLEFHLMEM